MTTTSALTRIPENTSFLQSTKFTFEFPDLPFLKYFGQEVALPSVGTTAATVTSPFADMYRHGDKLRFEQLVVSAIIDEDMRVWEETFDWIVALTKPANFEQYARFYDPKKSLYRDAILTVNTNANIPNLRFKFTNCHPVDISRVPFSSMKDANNQLTVDFTFAYDQYSLVRI